MRLKLGQQIIQPALVIHDNLDIGVGMSSGMGNISASVKQKDSQGLVKS